MKQTLLPIAVVIAAILSLVFYPNVKGNKAMNDTTVANPTVLIETTMGNITIELEPSDALSPAHLSAEAKIRCHQRRRLAVGAMALCRSTGGVRDSVHPGSGGLSENPQTTPRLLGSKIFTKLGASASSTLATY